MGFVLNPVTLKREFGGAMGAAILIVFLPMVTLCLFIFCNDIYVHNGLEFDFETIKNVFNVKVLSQWKHLFFNKECWKFYTTWFFGLTILDLLMPGYERQGVELRDGTKLNYLINGVTLTSFLFMVLCQRFSTFGFNLPELDFLYDNFTGMMITAWEFSIILATLCYLFSFKPLTGVNGKGTKERILSINGNSGNLLFDWFIGRELNPRIGSWDIKLFCELRPGLLLWLLLNLASAQHQYKTLGHFSNSMIIVNVLQLIYIMDGVLNEEGCLTMIDITTDGFGFMLSFGDLCWVPFCYCLQTRYLAIVEIDLSTSFSFIIILTMAIGFYIFKASNRQKSKFRQGQLPHMKSIKTKRGTKLLIEGWWGVSQHINYFGDILIALSWCLPTCFNTPLTYFYVFYFTSLLLHRQIRDEEKCREKYGESWEEYERIVKYKIVPYIY